MGCLGQPTETSNTLPLSYSLTPSPNVHNLSEVLELLVFRKTYSVRNSSEFCMSHHTVSLLNYHDQYCQQIIILCVDYKFCL